MLTGQQSNPDDAVIENDGFWTDLTLGEFTKPYAIGTSYNQDTLTNAVKQALLRVNLRLNPFKLKQKADGFATAADFFNDATNFATNGKMPEALYLDAVYKLAKHYLLSDSPNGLDKQEESFKVAMRLKDSSEETARQFLELYQLENASAINSGIKASVTLI
jgi:hypothetical protein